MASHIKYRNYNIFNDKTNPMIVIILSARDLSHLLCLCNVETFQTETISHNDIARSQTKSCRVRTVQRVSNEKELK